MTQLCDLSATQLRKLIGRKAISPVEVFHACRDRIAASNPRVNAIPTLILDQAETAALEAEAQVMRGASLGLLHGLPAAIKDLSATAGIRTTYGSRVFLDHLPVLDDAVVAAIKAAGAVIVGKSNTPEFGAGANTTNALFGPTQNPYAPGRIVGGSSGGAAAALATGMVPVANGSDRGGSLRIPASFCGVVGFRPSPGMVSNDARVMGWLPLCVDGPMGRTVADTALLFEVLRSASSSDPLARLSAPTAKCAGDISSLKVAFSEDLGFAPVDRVVRDRFRKCVSLFGHAFARCEEVTPDLGEADEVFEVLRALDFVASYDDYYRENKALLERNVIANVEQGLEMSLAQVARATRRQTELYRRMEVFFSEFDLLICPTVSVLPFPVEQNHPETVEGTELSSYFHWFALTYGLTLTALPVVSLPCGMINGTPFGIQIVSRLGSDLSLLEWAGQLEAMFAATPELLTPPPQLVDRPAAVMAD